MKSVIRRSTGVVLAVLCWLIAGCVALCGQICVVAWLDRPYLSVVMRADAGDHAFVRLADGEGKTLVIFSRNQQYFDGILRTEKVTGNFEMPAWLSPARSVRVGSVTELYGWPFRCAAAVVSLDPGDQAVRGSVVRGGSRWIVMEGDSFELVGVGSLILPTDVIAWRWFLCDAAVLGVAMGVIATGGAKALWTCRAWARRRRGLCPVCGYGVGELPQCPECGRGGIKNIAGSVV